MILQIVRFQSGLTLEQILAKSEARAPQYRALKGLRQKYYLSFSDTGEYGPCTSGNREPHSRSSGSRSSFAPSRTHTRSRGSRTFRWASSP